MPSFLSDSALQTVQLPAAESMGPLWKEPSTLWRLNSKHRGAATTGCLAGAGLGPGWGRASLLSNSSTFVGDAGLTGRCFRMGSGAAGNQDLKSPQDQSPGNQ